MVKKITDRQVTGEQGVAYVRKVVADMGFLFTETGGVEAGIDGYIEIRNPETEEATNNILQVQIKASKTPPYTDKQEIFGFPCKERDIQYWLHGNAPVILIYVDVKNDIGYWKSLKEYHEKTDLLKNKKVVFNREEDVFTKEVQNALIEVATKAQPGAYIAAPRKKEFLALNLLKVRHYPEYIYVAETEHTSPKSLAKALREHDEYPPFEWIAKSKSIFSFHNLEEYPWKEICDVGTIETIDTNHFALSDDEDLQRDFVQLLNQALRAKVSRTLLYSRKYNCHYFKPFKEKIERDYWYESFCNRTKRDVVKGYGERKDGAGPTNYRHSAFSPQFLRFGDTWYLAVQPTYYFTRDGIAAYKYAAERLKGIKAMENNHAYLGQFQMWSHFLTRRRQRNLFDDDEYNFLVFEALQEFPLEVGIADELWRNSEDSEKVTAFSEADQEELLL